MTITPELEAAVERVTERLFEAADRNPSLSLLSCGANLRTILSALAEANERASLLQTAVHERCAERDEARKDLAVVRQSLEEQAAARRDPTMPVLVPSVLKAIKADAEAQWACAEDKHDRINAHGLMLLCEWQERALNPKQEGSRDHG